MLKLERLKNHQTRLIYEKQRFWTRELIIGVTIACFIHFSWMFLFKIDLGNRFFKDYKTLPTAIVASEKGPLVSLFEHNQTIQVPHFLMAEKLKPSIKKTMTLGNLNHDFLLTTADEPLSPSTPSKGMMTFYPALHPTITLPLSSSVPTSAQLAIFVDARTEQVVWWDWIKSTGNHSLDQTIEKTLRTAKLALKSSLPFTKAIVEVQFP